MMPAKKKPGVSKVAPKSKTVPSKAKISPKKVVKKAPSKKISAKVISLKPTEDSLDLLISFDDTGSMHSVRQQVRDRVNELVTTLFSSVKGLRVGVICHNDYCDAPKHLYVQDFTNDIETVKNFVDQDSPCGGGDSDECYELALNTAKGMNWKSSKRAMILIGDASPHQVGYRYGGTTYSLDWKKETADLASMGVKIYGIQALGSSSSTFFYEGISSITGGVKLELSQFQHISAYIMAVAYHQNGNLETYEKSNSSFSTDISLKNMFRKLKGMKEEAGFSDKVNLLSKFQVMKVNKPCQIREFVQKNGCTFSKGNGFYQLIDRTEDGKANVEEIQPLKEVIFVDKKTGESVSDTNWCRNQLKVPYGTRGKVYGVQIPDVLKKYNVFIQSTSVNRKLDAKTEFLYRLEHV